MQPHMKAELVTDALRMAWFRRCPPPGLIMHSDRGRPILQRAVPGRAEGLWHAFVDEPTRRLLGYARTKSLWGSLKVARLHGNHFVTRRAAMDEIGDWLGFYNAHRLHSTLGYVSPMVFEKTWLATTCMRSRSPRSHARRLMASSIDIEPVGFGASPMAFDRNAGRIDHVAVNVSRSSARDRSRTLPGRLHSSRRPVRRRAATTSLYGPRSGPALPADEPRPAAARPCARPASRVGRRGVRLSIWPPPVPATHPGPVRHHYPCMPAQYA